jgi:Tfp pilus assembly protein PilO
MTAAMAKRVVPIVAAAVAVVIVLVWYFGFYSPKSHDLSQVHQDTDAAQQSQQTLRAQLSNLRGLEANRTKEQAQLQQLSAAVPSTPDLANFILQANDIATQAGVDWLQVAPSPPVAGAAGAPTTINVTMQLEGGFFQVFDYLNRLEDMQRLVLVDNVDLSSKGGDQTSGAVTSDPTLTMSITGRMFTRAAPPAAASAGGAAGGTTGGTTGGTATTTTTAGGTTTTTRASTTSSTQVG